MDPGFFESELSEERGGLVLKLDSLLFSLLITCEA
jgi:hypothetical protein